MAGVYPVILCGGVGTRLWPLSRGKYPKQFVPFLGDQTLFQASAARLTDAGHGVSFEAPTLITRSDFRFIVTHQLGDIGIDPGAVLIEPEGKNTAPAVLAAALFLFEQDPEAVMLVAPSDHVVPDTRVFHAAVNTGLQRVRDYGELVTFGIRPERAETGYGYLQLCSVPDGSGEAVALKQFVEKPDQHRAEAMLESGGYLWNSGIFLFSARSILEAFDAYAPKLVPPVRDAVRAARADLGFLRLDSAAWQEVEDISLDYAVMEHAGNLSVVPFSGAWSDLGSWEAVHDHGKADATGVVSTGPVVALECENCLLRAESADQVVVGLGLKDLVVVAMPDAVLVADMSRTQDVKKVVQALKSRNARQAEEFPKDHRPWGWFESLAMGARFQVKRIVVDPGAALSLQSHHHRAEHWIVVEGTALVTIGDKETLVSENQSVYVPLGEMHRLKNPGKVPMVLIEVQTGGYLGEDDIQRYVDAYARV
ncbi:MAG: mannose-1-phosphate guanylyltransferase/mannose-6-phosphate isomerase [Roseovarius sp.]|nr:mannose-1-phosphate guanylyltransferase/mannose-6-phosphate isomerase [Roseovarius sp.]